MKFYVAAIKCWWVLIAGIFNIKILNVQIGWFTQVQSHMYHLQVFSVATKMFGTINEWCDWIMGNQPKCHARPIPFYCLYTHTLLMHSGIVRLSWLVRFSGANFADYVKSRLRQWGPWRALDGRYGSWIGLSVSVTFLRTSMLVWAYNWFFLDS